jgi:hypothetical protein
LRQRKKCRRLLSSRIRSTRVPEATGVVRT